MAATDQKLGPTVVAAAQTDPKILNKAANLEQCLRMMDEASKAGARLIVFPECHLSGYMFSSLEEARPMAEPVPGPSIKRLVTQCRASNIYAVVGLIELDNNSCYNCVALVGPEGFIGKYRKVHLPLMGFDRYAQPGDKPFAVYPTAIGNIGMVICYDQFFPESARSVALRGAHILAHVTNFVTESTMFADFVNRTRAIENHIYIISSDRVGVERGTKFLGRSQIVSVGGRVITEADDQSEMLITGTIYPPAAESKLIPTTGGMSGEEKMDFMAQRRPDLYGIITETKTPTAAPR